MTVFVPRPVSYTYHLHIRLRQKSAIFGAVAATRQLYLPLFRQPVSYTYRFSGNPSAIPTGSAPCEGPKMVKNC